MVTLLAAAATAVAVGGIGLHLAGRRRPPAVTSTRSLSSPVAGLDVSSLQFWTAVIGAASVTFLMVLGITGLLVVSVVPALVVATLPRAYFARKRARRVAQVQQAWPDGLRDILASIRSGSSLPTAIESLASFGPAPLRDAFQGFAVYARSLGVMAALEIVREDLADPTSDRIIEVLIMAYERGGAVVPEILSDLAEATVRDLWAMEEVRTEALEQKINSRVVFVIPWLVLVVMTARSGAFREFYATPIGISVAVVGGLMSLLGIFIASRLGSSPEEPRVFAGTR